MKKRSKHACRKGSQEYFSYFGVSVEVRGPQLMGQILPTSHLPHIPLSFSQHRLSRSRYERHINPQPTFNVFCFYDPPFQKPGKSVCFFVSRCFATKTRPSLIKGLQLLIVDRIKHADRWLCGSTMVYRSATYRRSLPDRIQITMKSRRSQRPLVPRRCTMPETLSVSYSHNLEQYYTSRCSIRQYGSSCRKASRTTGHNRPDNSLHLLPVLRIRGTARSHLNYIARNNERPIGKRFERGNAIFFNMPPVGVTPIR